MTPDHTREPPAHHSVRGRRTAFYGWVGLGLSVAAATALVIVLIPALRGDNTATGASESSADIPAIGALPEPAPGQTTTTTHGWKTVTLLPGQPLHVSIPAVGLDAAVATMTITPGEAVDPPTPGSAYWLSNYGTAGPGSTNTTYIAGHTYRGRGRAVFNPLLDVPHSSYTVHAGDAIVLTTATGTFDYTITATDLYDKISVQQQTELWKRVPGRLVLVTCFQYNGGTSSQQNFVVYAQIDPGQ
jgi:hypothetical protein